MVVFLLLVNSGVGFGLKAIENSIPKPGSVGEIDKVKGAGKERKVEALNWYREHFAIWEASQGELVAGLGENVKRDRAYSQRTISALEQLSQVLPREKKQDLESYLVQYRQVAGVLERGLRKAWKRKQIKRTLNNLRKEIEKKFSYKVVEVRDDLIKRDREIVDSEKVPHLAGTPPARGKRYRYVADKNSRTFHRVMCIYASKIKKENRVYFETKKEARKSGRRFHRHRR